MSALLVAGCGTTNTGLAEDDSPISTLSSEFGYLGPVCRDGNPTRASTRGVTADTIRVGVFTDFGFTKNPEFIDAAMAFASWCNARGGIEGRRIEVSVRDTNLTEVRQRMLRSCDEDFAIVGGGAGLDALGVRERLNCLLPSFPAQVVQPRSVGADLEFSASPTALPRHDIYTGFRHWLVKEAYPASIGKIGFVTADSPVSKVLADKGRESFQALGATIVYDDPHPIVGMTNWMPIAQTIKDRGVRGLVFNGEPSQLAKLEQALTTLGHRPDWIDATNNNYSPTFLEDAGASIGFQNNVADLGGVVPFEKAETVTATHQVKAIFDEYAPNTRMSFPQLRAISAWLLFAMSAAECGDDLTRRCLYDAASSETSWTAGGLQGRIDLSNPLVPKSCFNVEQATTEGWRPADFTPDTGLFRCNIPLYKFRTDYGSPMTLADVGKTLSDLE
ncbi:ABC transporter substrate-binding protein [Nocardia noduli]|uniref:ABC transporter substrate-binding protein n=1 Tax=Nocardia noduli TaxID=2815722 RepID=UPI0027E08F5F|nr:ABC transporter substrate-binding protein [Nocardia noduli]